MTRQRCRAATFDRYNSSAWFVGRFTTDKYDNMDQVVAQALATFCCIDAELNETERARGPLVRRAESRPAMRGV